MQPLFLFMVINTTPPFDVCNVPSIVQYLLLTSVICRGNSDFNCCSPYTALIMGIATLHAVSASGMIPLSNMLSVFPDFAESE